MKKQSYLIQPMLGWREWIALPELKIASVKAKIDTGADTSALHAFRIERYRVNWLRFHVHPLQNNNRYTVKCKARILDQRSVSDSGGHREKRYVIETLAVIGDREWPIEITLADRTSMRFRMLLGRSAIKSQFLISCARSYLQGN